MKRISTHILDMVQGRPATEVPVRLEKQTGTGDWRLLTAARTDQDGRCANSRRTAGLNHGLKRSLAAANAGLNKVRRTNIVQHF